MTLNNVKIFFRNDDPDVFYYGDKRQELYQLTELFIKKNIPLVHAVVPNSITDQTISYLLKVDRQSDLLEFIQHGWSHGKYATGEFDATRSYFEQHKDIKSGRIKMQTIFGDKFFSAFTAPYGIYSNITYNVLRELNFKVVSSSVKYDIKNRIFNTIGHIFGIKFFKDKRVSYHDRTICHTNLQEISISINIMRKDKADKIRDIREIINKIRHFSSFTNNIGILVHHINLKSDHFLILEQLLEDLMEANYSFSKISSIYNSNLYL